MIHCTITAHHTNIFKLHHYICWMARRFSLLYIYVWGRPRCIWPMHYDLQDLLWRMPSSGMLRGVALVRTNVSEERTASIIRATRIGKPGNLAVTSNQHTLWRNTMSVLTRVTSCNIPEDGILHSHRRENLKYYKTYCASPSCLSLWQSYNSDAA
jgi:hypothetical protein